MHRLIPVMLALGVFLVVLVAGGLFLPGSTSVQRSTTIDAGAAEVYPWVADFSRFNQWSPWAEDDPDAAYEFAGPDGEPGWRMHWRGETMGEGSQTLIDLRRNEMVRLALEFGDFGRAESTFELTRTAQGTQVLWRFTSHHGNNLLHRYMGWLMSSQVAANYERGLERLKQAVEQRRRG
jgi:hypothetical protein